MKEATYATLCYVLHFVLNVLPLRLLIGIDNVRFLCRQPRKHLSQAGECRCVPQDKTAHGSI
jgi:hypothetical protein